MVSVKLNLQLIKRINNLVQATPKEVVPLCSAKLDALSLRRAELIQELCKSHQALNKEERNVGSFSAVPNATTWASKFITAAHLLESYVLLRNHKEAKALLYKFRSVDPDRTERLTTDNSEIIRKAANEHQNLEEISFLTQFAYVLKKAGYEEIPEDIAKQCIEKCHKYDRIELEVDLKSYLFIRFWVYGRKEIDSEDFEVKSVWKPSFYVDPAKRVLHERVLVASRSKNSSNMILKGFKDIPLDHLEALLPEAKIKIPRFRRILRNSTFTITGIFAFFNIGMVILTEFHMNLVFVFMLFTGIVAFRITERHKTQKNKHVLALKRMLYYKSTANNSGLVLDIVNKAHERALKEVLLVYGTALILAEADTAVTEEQVANAACEWLSTVNSVGIDKCGLDFSAAFALLQRLGLLVLQQHDNNPLLSEFRVLSPEEASKCLAIQVQEVASE